MFRLNISKLAIFSLLFALNAHPQTQDGDEVRAEAYIHQGLANQKEEKVCADGRGGYQDICDEQTLAFSDGTMRDLEMLLPALTQAYAMFNTMGPGGNFTATKMKKDGKTPELNEDKTEKTEEKTDYCGYISMISEAASAAYTATQNQLTEQNFQSAQPQAQQVAAFHAIADSHKTMAKSAEVQHYSWGATTVCYTAYATQAAYQGDWKVYAKLAGSAFISWYYKEKMDAHKKREKLLKQMAKEIDDAARGCDPFMNKSCFCAEESSKISDPGNYGAICVPQALAARASAGQEPYVCVDQKAKPDPSCNCAKTNTCADKRLKVAGINIGLGATKLKDPLAALRPISKGFIDAKASAANRRNQAIAKNALKNIKLNKPIKLNNKQKNIARNLVKNGFPKTAAALIAKGMGGSAKLPSSATAGFSGGGFGSSGKNNQMAKIRRQAVKGATIRNSNKNSSRGYGGFGSRKKASRGGIKIDDTFARRAMEQAEQVQDYDGKSLFEVISARYQLKMSRDFPEVYVNKK